MDRLVKGHNIVPAVQDITTTYEAQKRELFFGSLSEETGAKLPELSPDAWYPVDMASEIWRAVAAAHDHDPEAVHAEIARLGRVVGDGAANTFMRLLIKFMTPRMLARRWHELWRKGHSFGEMSSDVSEVDNKKMFLFLRDVGDYDHIGSMAVGFLQQIFAMMGLRDPRVEETLHPKGHARASEYRVQVTWA